MSGIALHRWSDRQHRASWFGHGELAKGKAFPFSARALLKN
jgi:hypothetical protein